MSHETRVIRDRWGVAGVAICAALVIAFVAIAWTASRGKSPIYDEPDHAVSAYTARFADAFHTDAQDPALFLRLAAMFQRRDGLRFNALDPKFAQAITQDGPRWPMDIEALFRTQGIDGDAVIARGRAAMLLTGAVAAAVLAWWSWRLGGAVAAVVATMLFALDPNFLAHAPIVKNDVPAAMIFFAAIFVVWRLGQRVTVGGVLLAGVVCGAAVCIKFSGIILAAIVPMLLVIRAMIPEAWTVLKRPMATRRNRALAALAVTLLVGLIAYPVIWACYSFRYLPTPNSAVTLDMPSIVLLDAQERARLERRPMPTSVQDALEQQTLSVRLAVWADTNHLLPQAWTYGLVFQSATTHFRRSFLAGEFSVTGWWYYFPLVMLFKTPTATLAAVLLVPLAILARRNRRVQGAPIAANDLWSLACLAVPPIVYLAAAMSSNLNLGIRHVLPVYPFIYAGISWGAALILKGAKRIQWTFASLLLAALAIESLLAYPNYLPFFNFPSGGSHGGLSLLSDSNLDWGQDLKLLGKWQREHAPEKPLYLRYFGTADPAFYGVRYVNLPGGYEFGPPPLAVWPPGESGVIAISATHLQGLYDGPELRAMYEPLRHAEPLDVLGGSIYLFQYPLPSGR